MKALTKIMKFQLTNKITDRIIALTFGFVLWMIFSENHTKEVCLTVPLCFYNSNDNITCKGPENIKVHLLAKYNVLKNLDLKNLAVHIDSQKLKAPESNLHITEQDLFLPSSIKLVNYTPSNIVIKMEQKVCQTSSEQTV